MNNWKTYCNSIIMVGISFMLLSCLPKQHLSTETFLLQQPPVKKTITKSINAKIVYLASIQADSPFNALNFVFKLKPARYQLDYYHRFLSLPSQQLMTLFTNQLNNLTTIKLTTTQHDAQYVLNIKLNKLYIDETTQPQKAIIALSMRLSLQKSPQTILWWHNYREAIIIKDYTAGAENIVLAWNKGIQTIVKASMLAITHKLEQYHQTANPYDD